MKPAGRTDSYCLGWLQMARRASRTSASAWNIKTAGAKRPLNSIMVVKPFIFTPYAECLNLERTMKAEVPPRDHPLRGYVLDGQASRAGSGLEVREEPSVFDTAAGTVRLRHGDLGRPGGRGGGPQVPRRQPLPARGSGWARAPYALRRHRCAQVPALRRSGLRMRGAPATAWPSAFCPDTSLANLKCGSPWPRRCFRLSAREARSNCWWCLGATCRGSQTAWPCPRPFRTSSLASG